MTAQYSIRSGLSLIITPGSLNTLPGKAITMAQMFKGVGYATAIYRTWHHQPAPFALDQSRCEL